jgi:thiol-disulfide isomerase/thioredoxin
MVTLQAAMMAMLLSSPGQPEMLDFYADWCAPCRAMQPTIQALEAKGYKVTKVNIGQDQQTAAKFGVQSVPCYVMLVDGKEVERVSNGTSFSRLERMFKTAAARSGGNPPNDHPPGGVPATFAAGEGSVAQSPPARPVFDPNVAPAGGAMASAGMQNRPAAPPMAGNFNPPADRSKATVSDAQLLAASVRIRVEDPSGHSCGSGTIIDARGGKALVVTCGHIFRDSKGKGKIEGELFGPHAGKKVEGRLESFDSEDRDVGLISIQMPAPVVAARLAPVGYSVREGDVVASVGCDHGADPTVRRNNQVNQANGPNLWVNDQPTEGRSGGGLFSAEGYVVGVCKGRAASDHEGCYPTLGQIRAQLDEAGLAFVYQSPQGWESSVMGSSPMLLASHNAPLPAAVSSAINAGEQAALDEIHRHLKDGAEVVVVIRPRSTPGATSEVLMLDKASPELIRQLSAEARTKDGVQHTSLEVARPRTKLLEWSAGD